MAIGQGNLIIMLTKRSLLSLLLLGLPLFAHAQQEEKPAPIQFRAVLHDPIRPIANLYYSDEEGNINKLNFRPKDLSRPITTIPVNGSLVLYDKLEVDPENPAASVAASVTLPANLKQAIVVVIPNDEKKKNAYQLLIIEDSRKAFPEGESRIIPLIGVNVAVQAGEHKLPVKPGKITRVPPVKKVNDFNMAQTNFYYQKGESWIPFTERQLQYLDACRRLFIVHATPGALAPTVTTITDVDRG